MVNKFSIVGVFLLVLLIISIGFVVTTPASIIPPQGFTEMGLSNVTVTSNSSTGLSGDLLLMNFVSGGLGQSAYGDISVNEINNKIEGTVSKGYEFSSNLVSQRCTYPFKTSATLSSGGLFQYGYKYYSFNLGADAIAQDCSQFGEVVITRAFGVIDGYCVYRNKISGSSADFQNPYYFFWVDNKLQIDGQSLISKPITNSIGLNESYSSGVKLGEVGFLQWNGNLATGQSCDQTTVSNYAVYNKAVDGGQQFVIVSRDSIVAYSNFEKDAIRQWQSGTVSSGSAEVLVNSVNGFASDVTSSETTGFGSNIYTQKSESNYDGAFYYSPSVPYELPTFSLFIKADSLNFRQPEPVPVNVLGSASDMQSGSGGMFVTWDNIGDSGNFSVNVNCDRATPTGIQSGYFVASGGSGSASIGLTSTTSNNIVVNCDVEVVSNSFSQYSDSDSFSFNVSPEEVCVPNSRVCNLDNISLINLCKSDGSGFIYPPTDCGDKTCVDGQCVDTPAICGDGVCEGSEYLTCVQDCLSPPSDCISGFDCPDDLCRSKLGDGFIVLGYEPQYGLFGEYTGCDAQYNWVGVGLIAFIIIILGFLGNTLIQKGRK